MVKKLIVASSLLVAALLLAVAISGVALAWSHGSTGVPSGNFLLDNSGGLLLDSGGAGVVAI